MGQIVSGTKHDSNQNTESSATVDSEDQETAEMTMDENKSVISSLYRGSSGFLQPPFMNRDFSSTCGCIIAQEREKPMASSLLEHNCTKQNDISSRLFVQQYIYAYFSTEMQLPRRRLATDKDNTKSRPNDHNLHDFLSLLVTPSSDDTTNLEELIMLMKAHSITDSVIPQHSPAAAAAVTPNTFKFSFTNDTTKAPPQHRKTTTSFAPASDFKFSFSADKYSNFSPSLSSENASYPAPSSERPTYRRGEVYLDDYEEVDNHDDGNDDKETMDPQELEAIIQQRKILPLPKPRWKRKAAMVNEETLTFAPNDTAEAKQNEDVVEPIDKVAEAAQTTERQDDRKIAVVGRRWKGDEKAASVDDNPPPPAESKASKSSSKRNKSTKKKKQAKASETAKSNRGKKDSTKKGKKAQSSQKKGWLDGELSTSDISVVRSSNPDDWICSFCQYEILCGGLEAARRRRAPRRRRTMAKAGDGAGLSDEDERLSLVEVPVDSRIRVMGGLSPGPKL